MYEKSSLENYVLNETPQTAKVEYGKTTTLTFTNELKKGRIEIEKVDADDNSIKLKGVSFAIIDNTTGKVIENLTTNESGIAVSSEWRSDRTYTVTETSSLDNYILNTNSQMAILNYNQTTKLRFTNELKKGKIKIIKVDEDDNSIKLSGVIFQVKDNTTGEIVATLQTDSNGEAITRKYPK